MDYRTVYSFCQDVLLIFLSFLIDIIDFLKVGWGDTGITSPPPILGVPSPNVLPPSSMVLCLERGLYEGGCAPLANALCFLNKG
jgi:hypothetical protein